MYVDDDKCAEFGLDPKRVASIARRIEKAMAEARSMGLVLFGASGSGHLKKSGGGCQNYVANLACSGYDGGDGGDVY